MNKRPNILFILTDDQAAWTFGAEGHPNAHTPVMDRLARDGARFDNLFANASVCSPSRASLMTGRYPTETGVAPDGNVYVIQTESEEGLTPGLATWPGALRSAGYKTALVGKWHIGHTREAYGPLNHGYDRFIGWLQNGKESRDPTLLVDGVPTTFKGQYTSDVLADMAMDTIRAFGDDPFALSLHFWAPHANHGVPEDFTLPYGDRTWLPLKEEDLAPWQERELTIPHPEFPNLDLPRIERMAREYHASVHSVDRNVGRILEFLKEAGLAANTIVIFTSDQGYNMAHHGLWHKGNGFWITADRADPAGVYGKVRDNLFDHSLRVPGIVRWPGTIRPGTRVPELVSFVDWFPTLLDMAGVTVPQDAVPRGRSMVSLLKRDPVEWPGGLFAQHRMLRSFRDTEWKLVRDFSEARRDELYHVREDPFEKCNLIGADHPLIEPVRRRLDAELRRVMEQIGDPLLPAMHGMVSD